MPFSFLSNGNTARRGPNTLKALWCICIFLLFPLKTSFYGIHQTSFLPVEALEFQAENTFGLYFFPLQEIVLFVRFFGFGVLFFDTEYGLGEGSTVQWKRSPPSPGSLKALLFPSLLKEVQNKGTQGVRARYGAELPPFISIVRYPGRAVVFWKRPKGTRPKGTGREVKF